MSLRLFALVTTVVAIGSVGVDFALPEFVGSFLLPAVSLLVFVGVGLRLVLRLPAELVDAVQRTVQPAHASLWLRPE